MEYKLVTKASLIAALQEVGRQDWIGHPSKDRIVLAKYYYPDIDSGLELESCNDDDCINQLWEAIK